MACLHSVVVGPFAWNTIRATSKSFVPARFPTGQGLVHNSILEPVLVHGRGNRVSAAGSADTTADAQSLVDYRPEPGVRSMSSQAEDRSLTDSSRFRLSVFSPPDSCLGSDSVSSTVPSPYSRY